ncbi:hypothetical protein PR048_004416 [Dryococelus australis]|uniref:Uncharacterized protein n=1 Tax=Dryococelus australis TaxID=614101 RepID=A0ABQ9I678_9NEOP|nr:hypothetical protein PR048_004416 [Dryococelus australis]
MTKRERRLKRIQWRKNTAFSRQRRKFPQKYTPPESGEEEELNYPHQKIRAVVDKEKKKFLKGGRVKTSDKKGREKKQSSAKIERNIIAFFEDDRNSRILPGKKDVIKSESGRQQVRCLEDDMNNVDMFSNVQHFTWNHHETGYVKGAPDGIGGTCKRTADNLVSQGKYIPGVATSISVLKENIDKIIIEEVTKDDIDQMKQRFNFKDIKAFILPMCVLQVVADAAGTTVLHLREFSCLACSGEFPHNGYGQYPSQLKKKLNVDEAYGTNSDDGDD